MNKLTPVALTTLTALLTFSGVALAQDAVTLPAGVSPQKPRALIRDIKDERKESRGEIRDVRKDIKREIKDIRKESKIELKDLRESIKEKMREATSSDVRREIKKDARNERKEIKEERKGSVNAMKEKVKVLARQHVETIGRRFDVAIKQFENLAARIQSRIDKLKSAGIDISGAELAINTAKIAIVQAKTDAQALADLVAQVNSTSDAKALRAQIETAVKKVNESIKSAHKALETASKTLFKLVRSQRTAATTTKEDN